MMSWHGYEGKAVVVAGGGGTGMGASVSHLLKQIGAEVTVLDLREPSVEGVVFVRTDLGDRAEIDAAVGHLDATVHAVFNCQGVSGARPGHEWDRRDARELPWGSAPERCDSPADSGRRRVVSISSAGGLGWARKLEQISGLLDPTALTRRSPGARRTKMAC